MLDGTKAWVTHGGVADYYLTFCRTSDDAKRGISALLVPADTDGLHPQPPERKMGLWASPTALIAFDDAQVDADRLIGAEGDGLRIALSALDSGRLGIAAIATGLAQAALDAAVGWVTEREQFGKPDRGVSGRQLHPRRHGDRDRSGPVDLPCRRTPARQRAGASDRRRRWPSCSRPTPR